MTRISGADTIRNLRGFIGDQRGSTSIEYGMIAVAIAAGIAATYFSISGEVGTMFDDVSESMKGPPAE